LDIVQTALVPYFQDLFPGKCEVLNWPENINRLQIQDFFRLKFIDKKANVIFLGGVGVGKTHLASALGYTDCLEGHSVLFTSAIDVINTLSAAMLPDN
jgi:DNA replication protein DnaC